MEYIYLDRGDADTDAEPTVKRHKSAYRSSPMKQMMELLCYTETQWFASDTAAARRLREAGRATRMTCDRPIEIIDLDPEDEVGEPLGSLEQVAKAACKLSHH